jgi:hypothetical protein
MVTMTANWKMMYSAVPFKVMGKTFCEVLVSNETKILDILPDPPTMEEKVFLWWDTAIGSYIASNDRNKTTIVWGECTCEDHPSGEAG